MQVQPITNNTAFNGRIDTEVKDAIGVAIKMASCKYKNYRNITYEFYNTLKAIKNDGTNRELRLDFINGKRYEAVVKYGKTRKLFARFDYSVLLGIIDMGKKLFGEKVIEAKPKEFEKAFFAQAHADIAASWALSEQMIADRAFSAEFEKLLS